MNLARKLALAGGLTGAAAAGALAGATMLSPAVAQTATTQQAPSTNAPDNSSTPSTDPSSRPSFPAHGTPEHEALEKPVTGDAATKAQAAAVASLGGGTAGDVTTDASGQGYEVTVTKTDGSQTEVHLDSTFAVANGHGGH